MRTLIPHAWRWGEKESNANSFSPGILPVFLFFSSFFSPNLIALYFLCPLFFLFFRLGGTSILFPSKFAFFFLHISFSYVSSHFSSKRQKSQ